MAKLFYGANGIEIEFEERVLAHLKIVITTKLRQGESFLFNWQDDPEVGDGRSSVWLHPSIPLYFKFDEPVAPELNRRWIDEMFMTANSGPGLRLIPETKDAPAPTGRPSPGVRNGEV
ncbi:hypothetical protein SAMN04489806_0653 [Paramicrobacterium humi]|uniref:DUF7882 domain-containing protein n=1 Tax=Paramicrobacterium humi TaxID=640635 RepID=A0A1H4JEQ0_9MICO|nr:hypothetical protein [Microbacterium humi]SEB44565.1 hypothetical protein SAMN04489806_0653 [Microbacterium humi]